MVISKKDMGARAAKAAQSAPSIDDRLRHAQDLVSSHPIDEAPTSAPSRQPASLRLPGTAESAPHDRIVAVRLDLIDPNPFNARKIYRPDRVQKMVSSLSAHGQETAALATIRNGRYVLAGGHYRRLGLRTLNAPTMDLRIREGMTDRELAEASFRENDEREPQSALDNALSWSDLLKQGVYASEAEIAESLGISPPNINKTLSILRLPQSVLDVIQEDPAAFGLSVLYELVLYAQVADEDKALAMVTQVAKGEAGRKEIQAARALIEEPRERKRKETSRQYKIKSAGEQIGSLKEWDSGKVALEVVLMDPKERTALVSELRARFGLSE